MPRFILKTLIKLLNEYRKTKNLTPTDFVENELHEHRLDENEGQHFLHLLKHEKLLEETCKAFIKDYTLRRANELNVKYLVEDETHLLITKFACKIFDNEYVLDQLIYPLLEKTTLIKKPRNHQLKKDVKIKGNLTSTLREASRLIKEQETEIKRIEDIVKGGYSSERIEQLEIEEREEENRRQMEAIERKHLHGLLTYEEAILARKKVLEINKEKMLEFHQVRIDLLEKLEKWREEEQNKIKALVEKSQRIRQNAKESERKLQEDRQNQVRLQQFETKEMLRIAYEEKKEELAKKMDLIQEIRALQQIGSKMRANKEFDPTECPNFGLLCEMSIAELQERLTLTKIRMAEELEEKRRCILKGKEEQQKMVENVKNFISQTRRMSKPKPLPIRTKNLERSPELVELERRLQEKRSQRMKEAVNGGSPAERAGLIAGDSVIKINNTDVFNLRHKDAQDVVIRAGYSFDVTVQRQPFLPETAEDSRERFGGSTWKPSVVPTGSISTPSPVANNISPVTRTSLAANKSENIGAIGTGHNLAAKPFTPQVNGAVNGPKLVNKQYNSPLKLYSEESIAETLSAQTEVLSTGVLGVNFKKNEKNYDASNSAVLQALRESENDPTANDTEADSGVVTAPNSGLAGLRSVKAPETRPAPSTPQLPPGQNICAECERLIVTEQIKQYFDIFSGVFVRIKEKNLHVECFKCATCGTSLKNVGYYNINNKLYCDIHAKAAAIRSNSNPNVLPLSLSPGGKAPVSAISSALSSHSLPSPSPLSPKINNSVAPPYQPEESNENAEVSTPLTNLPNSNVSTEANNNISLSNNSTPLSYSKYLNKSPSIFSGAKPFSSVNAPLSPRAAPLSPAIQAPASPFNAPSYKAPSYSPASSAERSIPGIIWPPPHEETEIPTACPLFYPPPSLVEQRLLSKRVDRELELESIVSECEDIEEIAALTQFLPKRSICSEEVMSISERKSCTECIETITDTLETQKLVDDILKTRPWSPPPINLDIQTTDPTKTEPKTDLPTCTMSAPENICCQRRESGDLKRPTQFTPNTVECHLPKTIDNAVPQKWESPLTQAFRTSAPDLDTFAQIPAKHSHSALASALAIAPSRPFTPSLIDEGKPVPLPEYTEPYLPPERPVVPVEPKEPKPKPEKPKSKFVKALETAPERPFTPVGCVPPIKKKPKDPTDKYFEDLPKAQQNLTMLSALITAPDRPYSPLIVESVGIETSETTKESKREEKLKIDKSQLQKPMKPDVLPASFQINKTQPKPPCYYSPTVLYEKTQEHKTEEYTEETDTSQTKTIEKQTIHNPQMTQIIVEPESDNSNNIAPTFQAITCYYKSKRNNFSVEISTTPPILTPPPKSATPIVKTIESQPGYIEKEIITQEKRSRQQKTTKQEHLKEEERGEIKTMKQEEEVVQKKAQQPVILHKAEGLPSYQVQLSENVHADLLLMEKNGKSPKCSTTKENKRGSTTSTISTSKSRSATSKTRTTSNGTAALSATTDETTPSQPRATFKPVIEDRPPSSTFSPRPKSLTPSMINKPPPAIPYYQSNLVPQQMAPAKANILDPTSPSISRTPSPHPGRRSRSPSPFPRSAAGDGERAVSPAPGPPPNPLKSSKPLPTPRDSKIAQARENISTFIPEYKTKRDLFERAQGINQYKCSEEFQQSQAQQTRADMCQVQQTKVQQAQRHLELAQAQQKQTTQQSQTQVQELSEKSAQAPLMYISQVQAQTFPIEQQRTMLYESIVSEDKTTQKQEEKCESRKMNVIDAKDVEVYSEQTGEGRFLTSKSEECHQVHLDQSRQSQQHSVERSADGRTQIQRKTTVCEEYEQTHKEMNIQIEKNLTCVKKHPFHDVNVPPDEGPTSKTVHFTNPRPLSCSLTRAAGDSNQQLQQASTQRAATQQQYCATQQNSQECCSKKSCGFQQECSANKSCLKSSPQSCPVPQCPPTASKDVQSQSTVSQAPTKHKPNQNIIRPNVSQPNAGAGGGRQAGGISITPKRGRGILNTSSGEHANELCHANVCENMIELDELSLQIPNCPPPPPPVPVYSQINITIPYQCTSPQLDSIGSSPRSDYSSYSSSSSKNPQIQSTEAAKEKIMSEIKSLMPKLKKVSLSGTQSPRMNYIVNNVATAVTNDKKKVKSELLISVNDYSNDKLHEEGVTLPDNLTFANKPNEITQRQNGKIDTNVIPYNRGPFITALGKIWCPNHFICATPSCRRPLQDLGFVEEKGQLYCEYCFEQYLAPPCSKCSGKIKGDCLKAIGKNFHPECFNCVYCGKLFGSSPFFLEDGSPYCDADWNELFTTKCFACGFPVEAGDRWVEALSNNYHSQCFNCTMCKKNLEGQSFFAKGGRPFCKSHAR
ncbi:hypothetical protein NQ317_003784 [Molorchus minor]|uniref:Uncharacterized protein n=1 Tax=Molorchus minor TaxID=1323400 RepID=A0ABQ9JUW5_9CUCU|nr:hypothetical protein NQ317_003784 [Molorchus minor]